MADVHNERGNGRKMTSTPKYGFQPIAQFFPLFLHFLCDNVPSIGTNIDKMTIRTCTDKIISRQWRNITCIASILYISGKMWSKIHIFTLRDQNFTLRARFGILKSWIQFQVESSSAALQLIFIEQSAFHLLASSHSLFSGMFWHSHSFFRDVLAFSLFF